MGVIVFVDKITTNMMAKIDLESLKIVALEVYNRKNHVTNLLLTSHPRAWHADCGRQSLSW